MLIVPVYEPVAPSLANTSSVGKIEIYNLPSLPVVTALAQSVPSVLVAGKDACEALQTRVAVAVLAPDVRLTEFGDTIVTALSKSAVNEKLAALVS